MSTCKFSLCQNRSVTCKPYPCLTLFLTSNHIIINTSQYSSEHSLIPSSLFILFLRRRNSTLLFSWILSLHFQPLSCYSIIYHWCIISFPQHAQHSSPYRAAKQRPLANEENLKDALLCKQYLFVCSHLCSSWDRLSTLQSSWGISILRGAVISLVRTWNHIITAQLITWRTMSMRSARVCLDIIPVRNILENISLDTMAFQFKPKTTAKQT